jgi:hypothetical protein
MHTSQARRLLLDRIDQVGPTCLPYLGPYDPVIAEAVAEFERIELLREADPVAHIQAWREVSSKHERGVVREQVGLHADFLDTDVLAQFLGQNGPALHQGRVAPRAVGPGRSRRQGTREQE